MINLKSDQNGIIQAIYNIEVSDPTCTIDSLPDDFYKYFSEGKYLANSNGIYIREGWLDHDFNNNNWMEPDWKFRIHIDDETLKFFANNYPEFLVLLNEPPINPKYTNGMSTIYLNNIGELEKKLLDQLGIIIEEYENH